VAAHFGEAIALTGWHAPAEVAAGGQMTVTLWWEAASTPDRDYTAFIHLLAADGTQITGFDQAPGGLRFPTQAWRSGDQIVAQFPLTVPPATPAGNYGVWVGLYDAASAGFARLPVVAADGQLVANQMLHLGPVEIDTAESSQ
jgi:hypothetical protein